MGGSTVGEKVMTRNRLGQAATAAEWPEGPIGGNRSCERLSSQLQAALVDQRLGTRSDKGNVVALKGITIAIRVALGESLEGGTQLDAIAKVQPARPGSDDFVHPAFGDFLDDRRDAQAQAAALLSGSRLSTSQTKGTDSGARTIGGAAR